jgi:hypothetical protein
MSTSNCGGKSEVHNALTKHLLRERAASVDAWDHEQVEIAIKGAHRVSDSTVTSGFNALSRTGRAKSV